MLKYNNIFKRAKELIEKIEAKVFLVFVLFFGLNSLIYFSVLNISSFDDQLFYFRIADIFRQGGFEAVRNFQGAFFSDLVQSGYIYGISLYHYFLIPFTLFSDQIFGLKLSGVILASLAPTIAFFVLTKMHCKNAFFWVVIFFYTISSINFNYRLFLNRNFVLIGAFLLLEIYFIYRRKYFSVFLISLIHVWWHPAAFWLPMFLIICYELVRLLNEKKVDIKVFCYGLGGSLAAFLLYPTNSHSFLSPINPIVFAKRLPSFIYGLQKGPKIMEGSENMKGDFLVFANNNPILFLFLLVFIVFIIFLYIRRKRNIKEELETEDDVIFREYVFLVGILFFAGFLITKRFEDLLIPLILLGSFIVYRYIEKNKMISINKEIKKIFFISFFIFASILLVNRALDLRNSFVGEYEDYKKASVWLKNNTEKGEIIFNSFNAFNRLFFFNDYNRYIIGIEPKNMYEYDKELYWEWHSIVNYGIVCDDDCSEFVENLYTSKSEYEKTAIQLKHSKEVAKTIRNRFLSQYIFVDSSMGPLFRMAIEKNKDDFEVVYESNNKRILIYKIKEL